MELINVSYFGSEFFKFITAVLAVAFFAIRILILYFRGARYVFLDRLWAASRGKDFHDDVFRKYHQGQLDVERFTFVYGIKSLETKAQVYDAISWSEDVGVALKSIAKAGRWVKWKERYVKRPNKSGTVICVFLYIAISLCSAVPLSGVLANNALMRFHESGTWVWVNSEQVRPVSTFTDHKWVVKKNQCKSDVVGDHQVQLSKTELSDLCKELSRPGFESVVSDAVYLQRVAMGLLLFLMFPLIWLIWVELMGRVWAFDIRKQISGSRNCIKSL